MSRATVHGLLGLLLLAGLGSALPATGAATTQPDARADSSLVDGLPRFQAFRVFPYADRAQRLDAAGDHERAAEAWKAALRRAPEHPPLLLGLIESLQKAGAPAEALVWADRLPTSHRGALVETLRVRLLTDPETFPDDRELERWLAESPRPDALLAAAADAHAGTEGDGPTADWLAGIACAPSGSCLTRAELRVNYLLRDPDTASGDRADGFAALAEQRALSPMERSLHIEALLNADRSREALAALEAQDEPEPFAASARTVIHRTAASDPEVAEAALELMDRRDAVPPDQFGIWIEFAAARGDGELALQRAGAAGVNCLDRVALAQRLGMDARSRALLTGCDPADRPEAWLWAAAELRLWGLIEAGRMPTERSRALRQRLLVDHYERSGADTALVALLPESATGESGRARARALERTGETAAAGHQWLTVHAASGDLADLDQGTWLLRLAGADDAALAALDRHGPWPDRDTARALNDRLLALHEEAGTSLGPDALASLLESTDRVGLQLAVGRALARSAACDQVPERLDERRHDLAMGVCLMGPRPGSAAHQLERARDAGVTAAARPLAYALADAGEPGAAVEVWESLPEAELDHDDHAAFTRATLAARDTEGAQRRWDAWQRDGDTAWLTLGATIARDSGDAETAAARWERVYAATPSADAALERARAARALDAPDEAAEWLHVALEHEPNDPELWTELGYVLVETDPEGAIAALEQADALTPLGPAESLQLGYLHTAHASRSRGVEALRRGIDGLDPAIPPAGVTRTELDVQRYQARRTHDRLDRRWDFGASGWAATGSVPGELLFTADPPRNHAELWATRQIRGDRPLRYGPVTVFGRIIAEGSSADPLDTRAAIIGASWQPWTLGVNLGAQWVQPDEGSGDAILTVATQQFDGGDWRSDWRPDETRWRERRLYAEAAWWLRAEDYQVFARYDHEHHWRWRERPGSWFAYGLGEGRLRDTGEDLRAGLGLGLRGHTGEDHYNAWRRRHTVRIEGHRTLVTDLADRTGLFLRVDTQW